MCSIQIELFGGFLLEMTSAFVYEDLVAHVEKLRDSTNEMKKILDHRCENEKSLFDQLKSRSLIFIDPYANHLNTKHFDHQLINEILNKYQKDYVPKYLQSWIRIGRMNNDETPSPLNNIELKSTVSNYYSNNGQFIAYGQITIWIGGRGYMSNYPCRINVLLTDNMNKVKDRLVRLGKFLGIQLKLCTINEMNKPNDNDWNNGTIVNSKDTILSYQLYRKDRILMGRFHIEEKDYNTFFFPAFLIRIESYTDPMWFQVNPTMTINELKNAIERCKGIPADSHHLNYEGRSLNDELTLSNCMISNESTIDMRRELRGGMYHITSGRQDFSWTTYDDGRAIKNILKFKIKSLSHARQYSSSKLQDYILQAQSLLSTLYHDIKHVYFDENIPHLKEFLLPLTTDHHGSRDE